jgi:type I restriction-modification system DNA methylase subunit
MATNTFATRIQKSYKDFWVQIGGARAKGEHELRRRFFETVIEKGFGYPKECIHTERDRTDIWLTDTPPFDKSSEQMVPTVVIETKDFEKVDDRHLIEFRSKALSYAVPSATKYVGLTNFRRFYVWRVDKKPEQVCDTNLYGQTFSKPLQETIAHLACIEYDELGKIYDDFTRSQQLEISDPEVFKKFTQVAKARILDNYLIPRLSFLASKLNSKYQEFDNKAKPISQLAEQDRERELIYKRQLKQLEENYADATKFFECFHQWCDRVFPTGVMRPKTEKMLERFALETAYTLFARALLVRVSEDKGLLRPKIHDGPLISLVGSITATSEAYKLILQHAFRDASSILRKLFTEDTYDWYDKADGELNEGMKKTLWHLNQVVFTNIKGDVFKHIYQEHMDSDERKRFGEFYTPDEVINYLLDKVSYSAKSDLRQTRLLDPACGSGTFLVEALSRFMSSVKGKLPLFDSMTYVGQPSGHEIPITRLNDSLFGIFGFDVLPFAEQLSQTNLLSHFIDYIKQIKVANPDFKFDQLWVFRTDSLQPPNPGLFPSPSVDSNDIKNLRFDFVVGNPPYVCITNLKEVKRAIEEFIRQKYPKLFGKKQEKAKFYRTDIYLPFIAFGISWLKPNGRLGMIVSGKFLSTLNGQWLRRFILDQCVIEQIVDLMRVKVFDQDVYPILLILRRKEKEEKSGYNVDVKIILKDDIKQLVQPLETNILSEKDYFIQKEFLSYELPVGYFENPRNVFEIYASSFLKPIRDQIEKIPETVKLGEVLDVRQGIIRGGKEKWEKCLERLRNQLQINDLQFGDNFQLKQAEKDSLPAEIKSKCVPLVDGKTFGEFYPEWNGTYLFYDRESLTAPREEGIFETRPKLFVGYITKYLKASYDMDSIYVTNDTYIGLLKIEQAKKLGMSLLYLLGLLNSRVLDFYYKVRHPEILRGGWFKRYDYVYSELPIVKPTQAQREAVETLVSSESTKDLGLIQLRRRIVELKKYLSDPIELLKRTAARTVAFFNSKLIASTDKLADTPIKNAKAEGNKVILGKNSYITCTSERASSFVSKVISHYLKQHEGLRPKDMFKELILPSDNEELDNVFREIRRSEVGFKKLVLKFKERKDELDLKVAEMYGVDQHLDLIKQTVKMLTEPLES